MKNSLNVESSKPEQELFVAHFDRAAFESLQTKLLDYKPVQPTQPPKEGFFKVVFTQTVSFSQQDYDEIRDMIFAVQSANTKKTPVKVHFSQIKQRSKSLAEDDKDDEDSEIIPVRSLKKSNQKTSQTKQKPTLKKREQKE